MTIHAPNVLKLSFLTRKFLYSTPGNALARLIVAPVKRLLPEAMQFPVTGEIEIRIPEFGKLHLHVNPTCYIGKVLFWKGVDGFEPEVHKVFKALIKRSRTFLDVGANIGYYSLLASKYNSDAKVVSFEPLPAGFKYLSLNLESNNANAVTAAQLAVSDRAGSSSFFFSMNPKYPFVQDQLTSTGSLDADQASRSELVKEIPVTLTTLDAFIVDNGLENIDLIKLDTEATEHLVMDGARETIANHRPFIFCEVLPGKVESEIMSRVRSVGYEAFMISESGLIEVDGLEHNRDRSNDYLFSPPEKRDTISHMIARSGQNND